MDLSRNSRGVTSSDIDLFNNQNCCHQSQNTIPPPIHQTIKADQADREREEAVDVSGKGAFAPRFSLTERHHAGIDNPSNDNGNHHDNDDDGDVDDDNDINHQNYNRYLLDRWCGGETSSGQASPSLYASVTSPPLTPPFRSSVKSGDCDSRNNNDNNNSNYNHNNNYHHHHHHHHHHQQQQQQQHPSFSGRNASPTTSLAGAALWQPPVRNVSREMLWQPPVRSTFGGRPGSLRSSISHRQSQQHTYQQQPPPPPPPQIQSQQAQPQQQQQQQQQHHHHHHQQQQQGQEQQEQQPDEYPHYPNQSYAVLQEQEHPVYHVPPWLRGQQPVQPHPTESARVLATAGSASSKPAPGLFVDQPIRLNIIDDDRRPPSSSFYPSFIPEPKETHTVAVDIDEQTGNKLINEYEIIGELGRGEHGKVKLAVHGRTGRKVAIKVVQRYSKRRRLGKLGNPEDKVKKEVAILKKARHPNVVSLLEVIDDSNQQKAYIVLEYVENGEIIWRRKGLKEIVVVDKKRLEREKRGVADTQSFIAESHQFVESARLQREKMRKERKAKRLEGGRRAANPYGWSLEHGADTDEELTDDLDSASIGSFSTSASPSDWRIAMHNNRYWPDFMQLGKQDSNVFPTVDLGDDIDDLSYVPCLTIRQVRNAFQDAVLGLEYLHYQGIIHRDIKPANLLVSRHKRIKISDFGVSYLGKPIRDDEDDNSPNASSSTSELDDARELSKTVGTPAFYAPELCYTGPESDAEPYIPPRITGAIDIWSLGVTLYAMVFGRLPFIYDEHSLFHNIVHTPVFIPTKRLVPVEPKPSLSRSGNNGSKPKPPRPGIRADDELVYEKIDDDLRDLIKKLLTKDPTKRITLKEIKQHPWLLRNMERPERWLTDTDPARHGDGRKIEVSNEEVTQAVTKMPFIQRVKSNVARIGSTIFGRSLSSNKLKDKNISNSNNNSSSKISQATPVSGSASDLSRCSSNLTLPGRFGSKKVRSTADLAARSKSGGEPHPLSDYVSASTVDNGQEGATGGTLNDGGSGNDKPIKSEDHHGGEYDDDDDDDDDNDDDGAVFFGGGSWIDNQQQLEQSQPLQEEGKPVPRYDSSWRLSAAVDSSQGFHTEIARLYDRSSSIRHPYTRNPSGQTSVRYGEPVSTTTAQRSSLSSNDGMRSPSIWGDRTNRPSYDAESMHARIEENIVNPSDSREASLLKQRQFQREYFHPSLADSKVDSKAGYALSGSYSSRDSEWSPEHDINMEPRTAYNAGVVDPSSTTRSQSPTYPRPVSSSSNSHRTGTSRTSIVIPDPSITSHTSSFGAPGRRTRVHVPVPDRDEPPIYARFVPAAARKQGLFPVQSEAAASESSSSAEEESDDEDGLLYLGRVPRPSKIQLKK
ncbi:hypothetical protein KEM54_006938 [Ascosphaera aggregata]|nr:hypothetical protein KEM54_006938 [Ascosphaera aggregata]